MKEVNIQEKFSLFNELWTPKIIEQCNGQHIKIAKVKGEFVWHSHSDEDELFLIVKGKLFIEMRDKTLELNEGEMAVIPKGVEHKPRTDGSEAWILLIEPSSIQHTGDVKHELTVDKPEFI